MCLKPMDPFFCTHSTVAYFIYSVALQLTQLTLCKLNWTIMSVRAIIYQASMTTISNRHISHLNPISINTLETYFVHILFCINLNICCTSFTYLIYLIYLIYAEPLSLAGG